MYLISLLIMKSFDDFVQSFVRTEVLSYPLQINQCLFASTYNALHAHNVIEAIL